MIIQVVKLSVKQLSGENHKRTQQGASAKLESYLYCYILVYATTSCLSYILLKAIMLYSCALMSSSRSFYHVLGLWHHIMWHVMCLFIIQNQKGKENKINIKSETLDKRKEKLLVSKVFHNTYSLWIYIPI